jgi:hypothetical protein
MSLNIFNKYIQKLISDLSVSSQTRWNWHLFPDCKRQEEVVKASSGHFPQPFLIRDVLKNWNKDNGWYFRIPKNAGKNFI